MSRNKTEMARRKQAKEAGEMQTSEVLLTVGVDESVSLGKALLLGLQHVLAMDVYIVPIILAGILQLSTAETSIFIQMTFVAAGVATLIQTGIFLKMPVVQGPSYIPIGALAAVAFSSGGLAAMFGSLLPGALVLVFLGWPLKWFSKMVRSLVPPVVAGTVILVVGLSLLPTALKVNIYGAAGDLTTNAIIASISGLLLVMFMSLGARHDRMGHVFRLCSVILALGGGTAVAFFYGTADFSQVGTAAWFALPHLFYFGTPTFEWAPCLTFIFVYLVVLVETSGTWFAVSAVTGRNISDAQLNRGAVGEGLGCLVGAALGGTPVTGYSTNAGIIAVTGVGSRMVILAAACMLIFLGMVPKLMTVVASIPGAAIGGVFSVICIVIAMNGFRVLKGVALDERNLLIVGVPVVIAQAAFFMPPELAQKLPTLVQYLVASGLAVGALAAVLLNLILPRKRATIKE